MSRLNGKSGQGLVEYILVVFLMAILCIAAVRQLSQSTRNGFSTATNRLDQEFGG